jgi:hypothetical protein
MEVGGQLHVPAALPPEKETPIPIVYEAVFQHVVQTKISLPDIPLNMRGFSSVTLPA